MVSVRSHVRTQIAWLALIDMVCLLVGSATGILLRLGHEETVFYVYEHIDGWLLFIGGVILANYLAGSYRVQFTFSRFNLVVTWMFSILFALLILSITSYAWFVIVLGRGVLFYSIVVYSALSLSLKLMVYRRLFRSDRFTCRTAVIGIGKRAEMCRRILERRYVLPAHKVVAFIRTFEDEPAGEGPAVTDDVAIIDAVSGNLRTVLQSLGVHLVVVALDDMRRSAVLYPHLKRLRFSGVEVLLPLNVAEIYSGMTPLSMVTEETLMQASLESGLPMVWRAKRLFDIAVSALACILLLPLFVLVALSMKAASPRDPVLYSQTRAGRFGVPFRIHKFRTMRPGSEDESGPVWSSADDPRITWLGRILRRFRIDETPQFVNILKGEMSLVGPRPERPEITETLAREIPFYRERENVMPGLTGWAQIRHPYGSTVEDAARKLEYDLYYMKHLSLSLDLQILLSTLRIVLLGKEWSVD